MEYTRVGILEHLSSRIPDSTTDCVLVAIDGRDGAGKTSFADELAQVCRQSGSREVIRVSVDDFHNTRAKRYRRGPQSPEGFFLDSYDYDSLRQNVLDPLSAGGSKRFKKRGHDLTTDSVLDAEPYHEAEPGSIFIIDGLFLHRPELVEYLHMSVYLDVSPEICAQRMLVRDGNAPKLVPTDRYFGGQKMYLETCQPEQKADYVVDNSAFSKAILKKAPGYVSVP